MYYLLERICLNLTQNGEIIVCKVLFSCEMMKLNIFNGAN